MPVFSYGTMPSEQGPRRAGGIIAARSMRLVAVVLLSSAALVTLLALARGPTPQSSRRWLLQTQLPLASTPVFPPPKTPATEASSAHFAPATPDEVEIEPTEKDAASFILKASLDILIPRCAPRAFESHTFPVYVDFFYQ